MPDAPDPGEAPSNAPLLERDGHAVLDLDRYIPFLLNAIGNKWTHSSSKAYLEEFGVGVTEWRLMAMLAIEPRISAYHACQVIGLDKSAASRSLRRMEQEGLVRSWQETETSHKKLLELTPAGWDLHDRVIRFAHRREALLVSDLSPHEVEELASLLRRVLKNVPRIMDVAHRPREGS